MPQEKKNDDELSVYIGNSPKINYITASMLIIKKNRFVSLKARGRAINAAVDVAEILKNKFVPEAEYEEIRLNTEQRPNPDGKTSNVSSIEIDLVIPETEREKLQ
ncbi:MAG: RNA-binding protein [Candidatus Lokiarchaeota archaeon]|nr:RNA-binding protein [Candidatus Lokiarchaeota archaeon]